MHIQYGMAGMYYRRADQQQYSRSMGRRLYYYRCMGRLYCVLGCPRLYATSTEPTGTPISTAVREEYGYGCTAAVGGAMAPMLPPYSCAPYICCAVSAVCMRVRLLILCCCMYVGAPAAAVVAMIWRRSVPLHTRR